MPKPDDDDQQQEQEHDDDRSSVDERLDKVEATQSTILAKIESLFEAIKPKSDPKSKPKPDDDDEEDETPPKIITQVTSRQEIEERAPRPAHFLFRRIGR